MPNLFVYSVAFFVSTFFIVAFKKVAGIYNWVDKPNDRKLHHGEVPVIGGIAMYAALVLCSSFVKSCPGNYKLLLDCLFIIVLFGSLDDKLNLNSKLRLLIQVLTVLAMSNIGHIYLSNLGNLVGCGEILLPHWLSETFTVFCAVGIINAFNMIDGVDGLAGSLALVALCSFDWLSFSVGLVKQATFLSILACIVVGFLAFNMRHPFRRKATVFMGDAGSTMLGFALAWFAINLTQPHFSGPRHASIPPITAVWILAIPIMDTITVMVKRILRKKSPFSAGRDHLHHMLQNQGLSDAQVVLIILLFSILTCLLGITAWYFHVPESNMFYSFIGLFCVYIYLRSTRRKPLSF